MNPCNRLAMILLAVFSTSMSPSQQSTVEVDDQTVALWLFDDSAYPNAILTDAGPYRNDLRLRSGYSRWWERTEGVGNPDEEPLHARAESGLVEGHFGGALRLPAGASGQVEWADDVQRYGTAYLLDRTSNVPERFNIGYLDWTLEFWFKGLGEQAERADILEIRNEEAHRRAAPMVNALSLEAGRTNFILSSRILEGAGDREYELEVIIPTDTERIGQPEWHHLAFSYTAVERQLRHYVDGRQQSLPEQGGFLPMMGSLRSLTIGKALHGLLDEMRLSSVVRYHGDFTPPGSFSRNSGKRPDVTGGLDGPPLLADSIGAGIGAVELGSRKHLFIDDALIAEMENVQFKVNPPISYQVTSFLNDRPWEPTPRFGSTIPDICSIWDEGSELRMIYTNGGMWGGKPHAVCLASSEDGLRWEKPMLHLKNWGQSTENNIVLRDACQGSVVKDSNPNVLAQNRYKFAAWCMYRGYYVFTSPDALHWRRNETAALPFDPDGSITFYWDDQSGNYRGYIRALFEEGVRRRIGRIEIPEILKPWPFKKAGRPYLGDMMLARPIRDELPLVETGGQVYRIKAMKYPWAPDTYLAFPWRFIADSNIRPGSFLMVSRDGKQWKRHEDPYYFASGWKLDGREVLEALMEDGIVRRGNDLWQFGTVRFTEHGGALYAGVEHEGGIHDRLLRLVQRLDGFVSLDTGDTTGTVMTRPIVLSGDRLELNISSRGSTRVAVLDEAGQPFEGYSLEDCTPILADSVQHPVTWKNHTDVSQLAGSVVRVKFQLNNAKLFAFQFAEAD